MNIYIQAGRQVFKNKKYLASFILGIVGAFILLVYIPVKIVPGNDFKYQLSIMPEKDYVLFIILSMLTSLSISFNVFLIRRKRSMQLNQLGNMTFSGIIGIASSIFGGITCIACASTVLGFLGIGTVVFLYQYRMLLAALSVLAMLVSLHFTARKVMNMCEVCHVQYK